MGSKNSEKASFNLDSFKQTVISFDKGGIWKSLTPPLIDSEGKKVYCPDDNCSLHLNSISSPRKEKIEIY